jgi:hypothetical protein
MVVVIRIAACGLKVVARVKSLPWRLW